METVSRNNGLLAETLVRLRHEREALFPAGLFDEYGWETLLVLYAARNDAGAMPIAAVNAATGATHAIGQRWIRYLAESGQVIVDGDTATLSDSAILAVETWLTRSVAALLPLCPDLGADEPTAR